MTKTFSVPVQQYLTAEEILRHVESLALKPGTRIDIYVPDDVQAAPDATPLPEVPRCNPRRVGGQRLAPETREALKKFIVEHSNRFGGPMSAEEIARKFNTSGGTVMDYVRKLAVTTASGALSSAA